MSGPRNQLFVAFNRAKLSPNIELIQQVADRAALTDFAWLSVDGNLHLFAAKVRKSG